MGLAEYLAKNYLSEDKPDGKKRKGHGADSRSSGKVAKTSKNIKKSRESKESAGSSAATKAPATASETIYRDASGRKIDLSVATSQEEERQQRIAEENRLARQKLNEGSLQQSERDKQALKLALMKSQPLNTHADDAGLNQEYKEKELFEDPAAMFLSKKKKKKTNDDSTKLPTYRGLYPTNRFGIAPGVLWDGVDRSNGFEQRWITRQSE